MRPRERRETGEQGLFRSRSSGDAINAVLAAVGYNFRRLAASSGD